MAKDDKLGYFDKNGNQKIPLEYEHLGITKEGDFVGFKDGKWTKIEMNK